MRAIAELSRSKARLSVQAPANSCLDMRSRTRPQPFGTALLILTLPFGSGASAGEQVPVQSYSGEVFAQLMVQQTGTASASMSITPWNANCNPSQQTAQVNYVSQAVQIDQNTWPVQVVYAPGSTYYNNSSSKYNEGNYYDLTQGVASLNVTCTIPSVDSSGTPIYYQGYMNIPLYFSQYFFDGSMVGLQQLGLSSSYNQISDSSCGAVLSGGTVAPNALGPVYSSSENLQVYVAALPSPTPPPALTPAIAVDIQQFYSGFTSLISSTGVSPVKFLSDFSVAPFLVRVACGPQTEFTAD